ncbi:uncharacterized protein HMPREF1541_07797 [Cyphellophora europaea CBS 101466]|uniref:Uncharacterized protein n=1 Tax=Cyphellophora europaea (strain CBS 101466) TaxID=1220924 RepID=W2RKE9_CYPE1|nr:uncharacterized protein HMPREF1541_07797 [Cyphellophora europaea CBS 101466]ETN36810.1 hypothetical protein HMPREF1541_07797 [Cyphellophora europaea CBS 101466]
MGKTEGTEDLDRCKEAHNKVTEFGVYVMLKKIEDFSDYPAVAAYMRLKDPKALHRAFVDNTSLLVHYYQIKQEVFQVTDLQKYSVLTRKFFTAVQFCDTVPYYTNTLHMPKIRYNAPELASFQVDIDRAALITVITAYKIIVQWRNEHIFHPLPEWVNQEPEPSQYFCNISADD